MSNINKEIFETAKAHFNAQAEQIRLSKALYFAIDARKDKALFNMPLAELKAKDPELAQFMYKIGSFNAEKLAEYLNESFDIYFKNDNFKFSATTKRTVNDITLCEDNFDKIVELLKKENPKKRNPGLYDYVPVWGHERHLGDIYNGQYTFGSSFITEEQKQMAINDPATLMGIERRIYPFSDVKAEHSLYSLLAGHTAWMEVTSPNRDRTIEKVFGRCVPYVVGRNIQELGDDFV
ncbi:MAG: hypothetical protein FWC00_00715 [Firmicutes bacterium]|nr:hypothetical protein [Bacillota bacterium]